MQSTPDLDPLRFPIGCPQLPTEPLTPAERVPYLQALAELPTKLTATARAIGGIGLEQPYRPGGWNGRQVIHHLADTHMQVYGRYRLALTEDQPTIKPFNEVAWVELPDVAATPITVSLTLLEMLHTRWVNLLHHLTEAQWQRTYFHPKMNRSYTLDQGLVLYTWHGHHHLAHIELLKR
jgi:DinB superfamily